MIRLEDLRPNAAIRGLLPDCLVTVVNIQWYGSEAHRIRLAHLFDPVLAVHTSLVDPLPHQITAVYGEMLPRQPLRFLLAHDPGAGKTIMAGLLIKELIARGDLLRCLIVCDEAHKMSATLFGNEVKFTKRYRLGRLLSILTRHFLLMTATPHNGKEADFQLFMALLDGDRFEGRFRDGVHSADVSDLIRRMVKENLLKFDAPLFPERIAYTVPYKLSLEEAGLYKAVTAYVREEFNRAEALENGSPRKSPIGITGPNSSNSRNRPGKPMPASIPAKPANGRTTSRPGCRSGWKN